MAETNEKRFSFNEAMMLQTGWFVYQGNMMRYDRVSGIIFIPQSNDEQYTLSDLQNAGQVDPRALTDINEYESLVVFAKDVYHSFAINNPLETHVMNALIVIAYHDEMNRLKAREV